MSVKDEIFRSSARALPPEPETDDFVLRNARRDRVFDMMDRRDLDVCVFAREANVRYASGAHRLWVAGPRMYVPTCVVIRRTRSVHVMSFAPSRIGIPADVGLYVMTADLVGLMEYFRGLEGVDDPRRVGTDGMSALFASVLPLAFPSAAFVDAHTDLVDVRRTKSPGEITRLRRAAAIADAAVGAASTLARPGAFEHELQAAFLSRLFLLGAQSYSAAGPFSVLDGQGGDLLGRRRLIEDDALVAVGGGVIVDGYEGCVGRTKWCGSPGNRPSPAIVDLYDTWREVMDTVVEACVPGATGADLARAHDKATSAMDSELVVRSVGLGAEGMLAGTGLGESFEETQVLGENMVLAVRLLVQAGDARYGGEEMVLVNVDAPEILTRLQGEIRA